jgi:hypothetical protein
MSDDNNRLLAQINQKLSVLVSLSALNLATQKDMDLKTKVALLTKAGFKSQEIGSILHIRAESVRRLRSKSKSG